MNKFANYSIVGSGNSNQDILEWSKIFLAQNKWNPHQSDEPSTAPYSYLSQQSITFLFTGIAEEKVMSEHLDSQGPNYYLLEETVRKLIVQHRIPAINLQVQNVVCFGDAKNCIALQLKWDSNELIAFRKNLIQELNRLAIPGFKEIVDHFPAFSIHLPLAYKRMPIAMFKKFENELHHLLSITEKKADQDMLMSIMEYVKKSPLSQINKKVQSQLLQLGFSAEKMVDFQNSLIIFPEELEVIRANFKMQHFKNASLNVQSVKYVSRPELTVASGQRERILFAVDLFLLYTPIPDPFFKKITEQFPIKLNSHFDSHLILAGSFARGTASFGSDLDLLVLVHDNIEPSDIRKSLSNVAQKVFFNNVTIYQARHAINLTDNKHHQIDLVPMREKFPEMTVPYRVYDSYAGYWKPSHPKKARADLDQHPSPLAIRCLIKLVKKWNKLNNPQLLRSFHIERMLLRMPFNHNIKDSLTALGLAFDFMARHFTIPLVFDNSFSFINQTLQPKMEIQLQTDLFEMSALCRKAAHDFEAVTPHFRSLFMSEEFTLFQKNCDISAGNATVEELYELNKTYQFPAEEIFRKKRLPDKANWTVLLSLYMEGKASESELKKFSDEHLNSKLPKKYSSDTTGTMKKMS